MLSLSIAILLATAASHLQAQQVAFEWKYLNFSWPSTQAYEDAVKDGSYVPANTVITGIKVHKGNVYLSLPRWKRGIPATLAVLSKSAEKSSPLLQPYPNWRMQKLDDCAAFQYVQSMEIDPQGRMWVLENGRTEFRTDNPRTKCPSRLVILDLESDGQILLDYEFPQDVISKDSVFLNDLVLDHEDGGYAYITDQDSEKPGIVVFSLKDKTSWKVSHDRSMRAAKEAVEYKFEDNVMTIEGPVDGIALSAACAHGNRILYYTPLSSYEIFSVPVRVLKSRKLSTENVDKHITLVGRKPSQTDGMVVSADGLLYFGLLTKSAVSYYNTTSSRSLTENQRVLYQDKATNQWPDTFAMDEEGWLWWTPNALQNYFADKPNDRAVNYRVIKLKTSSKSYQYYEDGSYPELPKIN
ncbi:protein yellow-like [Phymastichus coffea]|uniref:protein yellow-like n=1 Tax=Phymastichus coffea TaxID=108790 RepID=UPI00273CED29|nr:protein yellow-like [Phymastichus coffea]